MVDEVEATAAPGAPATPRSAANPYAQPAHARPKSAPATMNVGIFFLIVCGIALMFGSVGSWVEVGGSVTIASFHASFHGAVNGLDPGISNAIGVNGYVTLICGIVLLVFGGLAMTNDDQLLAVLTFVAAAGTGVFAAYDMFRIVQKISQVTAPAGSSVSVGAGLICVLSAAALAFVISVVRLLSR